MAPTSREATVRRLRAAQALGGYSSVEDLAAAADFPLKRLREIYQQKKDARSVDLRHLAETCGLSYEFFLVDFATLGEPSGMAELREQLNELQGVVRQLARRRAAELAGDERLEDREDTPAESQNTSDATDSSKEEDEGT